MIGLYGLQACAASRRVREFGLRMALGAGRILASRLPGLTAGDPVPLAIAAGLLAVAGLAAECVPAWRAARIDAMEALRSE